MNTIFMNSEYSKTSDPHKQLLNLADKIDWTRQDKYVPLSIYYTWKNIKKVYKNDKFKISTLRRNG